MDPHRRSGPSVATVARRWMDPHRRSGLMSSAGWSLAYAAGCDPNPTRKQGTPEYSDLLLATVELLHASIRIRFEGTRSRRCLG